MRVIQNFRRILTAFALVFLLTTTAACSGTVQAKQPTTQLPGTSYSAEYAQLERGNTVEGQDFGSWVATTAKGIVQDAYVRDNNKLGIVITPKVRPTEVRPLAKSLLQGFHKNFPNQDLSVLVYAPDKQLILTAQYDTQSNEIAYK
ncbi:MAG: hypothetical protein KME64_06960 [Scytonematopsis contorta HA4267-MV1]|nr:hypothetical protein [Scytonematopsis contorta HA4267-MV1]